MTASWTTRDATPGSSSQSPSQSSSALMASAAHAQMMILPEESASVAMGAAGGATSEDADDAVDEYLAMLSSEAEGMEDNYEQVGYLKLRLREFRGQMSFSRRVTNGINGTYCHSYQSALAVIV